MKKQYYVCLNGIWCLLTEGGKDQHFIDGSKGTKWQRTKEEHESQGGYDGQIYEN